MSKIFERDKIAAMIPDKANVIGDGISFGCAEELFVTLKESFLQTGHPRELTIIAPGGSGDTRGRGFDHFAEEGFISCYTGSYLNLTRKIGKMILQNKIEGYLLPLGTYCLLLREIAGGRPGLITRVGLKTYVDPRIEGGRLNAISTGSEFTPELITFNDREHLYYKPFHIDVALMRGTTADEDGNITMEKEAGILNALSMAMATRKCGGKVIVEVERIAQRNTLKPLDVKIPGILVDAVVLARKENRMQTWHEVYNPSRSGEIRIPEEGAMHTPLNIQKVIARRALLELRPAALVNVGAGISEFVTSISWEEGVQDQLTFVIEAGMIGGIPGFGLCFNTATNPACIIDQPSMIDLLDGGIHDYSCVGFGEIDKQGNINVSKLKSKISGIGGFLDVAPHAKSRIHCGAFTAGKKEIKVENGKLNIIKDGDIFKFTDHVEHLSVSGEYALDVGQPVKVVTERAVFDWSPDGWVLTEIAPGVDLEKHILAKMAFKPNIHPNLKEMPAEIFQEASLNLRNQPLWQRNNGRR